MAIVWPEGLRQLKNYVTSSGIEPEDLLVYIIVLQETTLHAITRVWHIIQHMS
jgi:hypothetical protein